MEQGTDEDQWADVVNSASDTQEGSDFNSGPVEVMEEPEYSFLFSAAVLTFLSTATCLLIGSICYHVPLVIYRLYYVPKLKLRNGRKV